MPASLINAVVDSAVNAGVVPCGNQQPAQISHYPHLSVARRCTQSYHRRALAFRADQLLFAVTRARLKKTTGFQPRLSWLCLTTGGLHVCPFEKSALAAASTSLFVLLWSSGAIFSKWGLAHASPFAFLLIRFAIALCGLVLLVPLLKLKLPRRGKPMLYAMATGWCCWGLIRFSICWP